MSALRRSAPPALVSALAIAIGASYGKLFTDSDTNQYLALAAGHAVPQPFAARQLGPLLVRGLSHLGLGIHQGFWLLGILSLAFFVGTVAYLLDQAEAPGWLRWSVLGLSFWGLQFGGMVLPDLFYAALLCGFLLLIHAERPGWAAAMLLPLMVARESTLLVLLCWLFVGWRTLTLRNRLGSIAAVAAGAEIVHRLAAGSGGNREGLPPMLYLLGKIPWNFARNFLGLEPWARVSPGCGVPVWHRALRLGSLHGVGPLYDLGYCGFQREYPVRLVAYALATFGLLPLLLLWQVRRGPAPSLLARFCLGYGITAYLSAGLLGFSVQRLYGYGWPAFLVGLPLLLAGSAQRFRGRRWAWAFVGLTLAGSWLEWRLDKVPLLLASVAVWLAGALLLRRGWRAAGLSEESA